MKTKILSVISGVILFLTPHANYAQAPNLGTAANFVLFTTIGAVTNSSPSQLTGNVGSNSGSSTGFGNVNGVMDNNNVASAQCATDVLSAYNELNTTTPTFFPAPLLGDGDTLVAGVYHISAASTLDGHLILNAQGNPSAVFIFQIEGSLSMGSAAKVILINGAMACNVFWKVEGLVSIAAGSTMRGTIIANNAAINMNANDTLEGRALSTTGAVSVGGVLAYTPIGCGSAVLTGPAAPSLASTACYGIFSSDGAVSNSGITNVTGDVGSNVGGATDYNPSLVSGTIHTIPDASTATCAADLANVYTYLNTLPYDIELLYPAQFGNGLVLTPHTYLMNAAVTFTDTVYLNAEGDSDAVFVIQVSGAFSTGTFSTVKLINGTQSKNVYWKVNGAVNINNNSVFNGTLVCDDASIILNTGVMVNGRVLATTGSVTTNAVTVLANTLPGAGSLTGASAVCTGSSITLTDGASGGVWASSNAHATVSGGIVTGVTTGIDTIRYIASSACGADTATKIITVSLVADAGTISGLSAVCVGSLITLTESVSGGTWSSSNADAIVTSGSVNGVTNGTDTIRYIIASACGTDTAMKVVDINSGAGAITGLSGVCSGSTITLADLVTGGIWSSSNTLATITGGMVTGVAPGIDTIMYVATGTCGAGTAIKIITIALPPDAGTITGASSVCIGSFITLTESVTGGVWSSSNTTATVAGGIVTADIAGTDTIKYTVANTCGIAIKEQTVAIDITPDAGSITGIASMCAGMPVTFTNSVTGGIWSSSNAVATVTGGIVTGVTGGIDTIIYTFTNACGAAVAVKTILINALPILPAINTQPSSSACMGTMYQNFGTSTPPSLSVSYNWTAVNATIWAQGALHQYALVNFDATGTADVTLTVTNATTTCVDHHTIEITVGGATAQTPSISYIDGMFVCTPADLSSYQWGYDDVNTLDSLILNGQIDPDYINASPDFVNNYYWVMTTNGGCEQKTYYNAPTAVQNINNESATVSVYPNPARTAINVTIGKAVSGDIQVVVFNMLGEKMSTVLAIDNKAVIDVSGLPNGYYQVACYHNGTRLTTSGFIKN